MHAREGALLEACRDGKMEAVRQLLSLGADVNCCSDHGVSALHWAVVGGFVQVVELLLDHGALLNITDDKMGNTPLHAALGGSSPTTTKVDCVALLLKRGADTEVADKEGFTPVHSSAIYQQSKTDAHVFKQCTDLLVKHGADLSNPDLKVLLALRECVPSAAVRGTGFGDRPAPAFLPRHFLSRVAQMANSVADAWSALQPGSGKLHAPAGLKGALTAPSSSSAPAGLEGALATQVLSGSGPVFLENADADAWITTRPRMSELHAPAGLKGAVTAQGSCSSGHCIFGKAHSTLVTLNCILTELRPYWLGKGPRSPEELTSCLNMACCASQLFMECSCCDITNEEETMQLRNFASGSTFPLMMFSGHLVLLQQGSDIVLPAWARLVRTAQNLANFLTRTKECCHGDEEESPDLNSTDPGKPMQHVLTADSDPRQAALWLLLSAVVAWQAEGTSMLALWQREGLLMPPSQWQAHGGRSSSSKSEECYSEVEQEVLSPVYVYDSTTIIKHMASVRGFECDDLLALIDGDLSSSISSNEGKSLRLLEQQKGADTSLLGMQHPALEGQLPLLVGFRQVMNQAALHANPASMSDRLDCDSKLAQTAAKVIFNACSCICASGTQSLKAKRAATAQLEQRQQMAAGSDRRRQLQKRLQQSLLQRQQEPDAAVEAKLAVAGVEGCRLACAMLAEVLQPYLELVTALLVAQVPDGMAAVSTVVKQGMTGVLITATHVLRCLYRILDRLAMHDDALREAHRRHFLEVVSAAVVPTLAPLLLAFVRVRQMTDIPCKGLFSEGTAAWATSITKQAQDQDQELLADAVLALMCQGAGRSAVDLLRCCGLGYAHVDAHLGALALLSVDVVLSLLEPGPSSKCMASVVQSATQQQTPASEPGAQEAGDRRPNPRASANEWICLLKERPWVAAGHWVGDHSGADRKSRPKAEQEEQCCHEDPAMVVSRVQGARSHAAAGLTTVARNAAAVAEAATNIQASGAVSVERVAAAKAGAADSWGEVIDPWPDVASRIAAQTTTYSMDALYVQLGCPGCHNPRCCGFHSSFTVGNESLTGQQQQREEEGQQLSRSAGLLLCRGCLRVCYCSEDCAREAWANGHMGQCRLMQGATWRGQPLGMQQ